MKDQIELDCELAGEDRLIVAVDEDDGDFHVQADVVTWTSPEDNFICLGEKNARKLLGFLARHLAGDDSSIQARCISSLNDVVSVERYDTGGGSISLSRNDEFRGDVILSSEDAALIGSHLLGQETPAVEQPAKAIKEIEAEDASVRQAAECAAEDLRRVREARLEDESWPTAGPIATPNPAAAARDLAHEVTFEMLHGRRVFALSTKELIDEVIARTKGRRESATTRIGSANREAGREYSLAITALEDAQMRFTRGLSKQKGVFKPVDLERLDAATERAEFEGAVQAQQHWGLGVFGREAGARGIHS